MTRLAVLLWTVMLAVTLAGRAHAANYYVSPQGDDTRAGTSADNAWRSLAKVNNAKLQPGDNVLLEGGQTFDGPLVPWASGRSGLPITYSSYGQGRATISSRDNNIVFLHGVNWVTIQNLRLTADGAASHVIVSNPATTSAFITIKNNLITNTAAFGINSPSLADHDWTIQGNTISETGETGVTFRGAGFKVIGNVVEDTGLHPSESAHGIYAKGPGAQVIGNVIRNFSSSGISIRYPNSLVRGNMIDGGAIGVSYFQDKGVTGSGTSTIAYNRITGVDEAGIFLDDSTVESFVIVNNTMHVAKGNGLNLHRVKGVTLANNVVTGTFDSGYAALLRKPAGEYVEHHNLWFPGTGRIILWNGAGRTLDQYRAQSRQGAGDLAADPLLSTTMAPRAGSPLLDAGIAIRGLGYRRACDGKAFSYCGRAPDLGAIERKRSAVKR